MAAGLLHWLEFFIWKSSLGVMTFWLDLHFLSWERVWYWAASWSRSFSFITFGILNSGMNRFPFPQLQAANNEKDIQKGDTTFLKQQQQQQKTKLKANEWWILISDWENNCQATNGWQAAWPLCLEGFLEILGERSKTGGNKGGVQESWTVGWGVGLRQNVGLGWNNWRGGAVVQMEDDGNKDVGSRVPGVGQGHRLK